MDIGKNWGWIDRGKREECKYGDIYEERLVDEVEIEKEELRDRTLRKVAWTTECWVGMKIEAEMKKMMMREIIYG